MSESPEALRGLASIAKLLGVSLGAQSAVLILIIDGTPHVVLRGNPESVHKAREVLDSIAQAVSSGAFAPCACGDFHAAACLMPLADSSTLKH